MTTETAQTSVQPISQAWRADTVGVALKSTASSLTTLEAHVPEWHSMPQASSLESPGKEEHPDAPLYIEGIRYLLESGRLTDARLLLLRVLGILSENATIRAMSDVLIARPAQWRSERGASREQDFAYVRSHAGLHRGKWVALSGGEVVASAKELKKLMGKLRKAKLSERPLVHYFG